MRLAFVLGTAAELIKIYPLLVEAGERKFPFSIISTGQNPLTLHKQFEDFGLNPENLVHASRRTEDQSGLIQECRWLARAWLKKPEKFVPAQTQVIVVQGDSLSTLAGANWGRRMKLPVAHIEAGLRSGKIFSPFPEEVTRRMVARRASLHMAPDDLAAENLRRMGLDHGVFATAGNTLADAVRMTLEKRPLGEKAQSYVVANLHRFENLHRGSRWHFLLETLAKISKKRKIHWVMHPRTERRLKHDSILKERMQRAGVVIEPHLPFSKFIHLIAHADYVVTDGGSNQEECHYLGVPCLILRDTTERSEGIHSNCLLAKFDKDLVDDFINDPNRWRRPPSSPNFSPAKLIMDAIARALLQGGAGDGVHVEPVAGVE